MRRFAWLLLLLLIPAVWHPRHSQAQNLPSSEQVVPPGFGTLKQEDLQIALATTALEIRFTPLDPRVINLLAPDAYRNDYLDIKLFDRKGNQLASESLYDEDEED